MSGEQHMTESRGKELFAALAVVVKGGSDAEKGSRNDDHVDVSTSGVVEYGDLVEDGLRYRGGLAGEWMVVRLFRTIEALTQGGLIWLPPMWQRDPLG